MRRISVWPASNPSSILRLDVGNAVEELVEHPLSFRGQREEVLLAVLLVALPGHQPPAEQVGHHLGHRLGADEGVARQLGRGDAGVPLEDGERGVLQRGQVGGRDDVVERLPDRQLHLLDQVEQRDVAVVGRLVAARSWHAHPGTSGPSARRQPVDTGVHGRDDAPRHEEQRQDEQGAVRRVLHDRRRRRRQPGLAADRVEDLEEHRDDHGSDHSSPDRSEAADHGHDHVGERL